ncbi:MAG: polyphenol oxidase family protein [Gemmatimonadota bacterium]|nr:polyphenol oxidase family protein [Gemmatimonadota bacterium]MDE2870517.1 polyphenol oxidase family protein [Gemmatimonadota bacterium]
MTSGSVRPPGAAGTHRLSGDPTSGRAFSTTPVPEWGSRFPWLRAGTTRRIVGRDGVPPLHDMLVLTAGSPWRTVVRSRQVHGPLTRIHADAPSGLQVVGEGDGHATRDAGVLLTVTIADCVPVFIADPDARAVGLLHAGWRGTAAGVVESGIGALERAFGSRPDDMAVHLGPAICGQCYEVGPEVFRALGEPMAATPGSIDLRRVVRRRAARCGVRDERMTVSGDCTLCGDGGYFSHRRGDAGRQRAYIGIVA